MGSIYTKRQLIVAGCEYNPALVTVVKIQWTVLYKSPRPVLSYVTVYDRFTLTMNIHFLCWRKINVFIVQLSQNPFEFSHRVSQR